MTNETTTPRRRGLGGLLTAQQDTPDPAAPPAPAKTPSAPAEAPAKPAPASKRAPRAMRVWAVTDDSTGKELTRVSATTEKRAIELAATATDRAGGFSLEELGPDESPRTAKPSARIGEPAMLPRRRARRVAKDKLTVSIPAYLIDGLADLADRDGTNRYDEVAIAIRAHLISSGIDLQEE